jgi:hypothetical protein
MCFDDGTSCTSFHNKNRNCPGGTFVKLAFVILKSLYNGVLKSGRDIGRVSANGVIRPKLKIRPSDSLSDGQRADFQVSKF